jgi:hypothetical protein
MGKLLRIWIFKCWARENWSDQIRKLEVQDIVCAYITERGFVGIGECISKAEPIRNFRTKEGKFLRVKVDLLGPTFILTENIDDDEKCEYAVGIKWLPELTIKNKEKAHSVTGLHLGINQNIYTELRQNTPKVDFIKKSFSVDFAF